MHDIASRRGSTAIFLLKQQREEATQTQFVPRHSESLLDSKGWGDTVKTIGEGRQKELLDALQGLRDWYLLLVRASSLVFEFEYWKRINL